MTLSWEGGTVNRIITNDIPTAWYGLAKVHKDETPLRPVLSLPGSSYENLNKMLAKFFDNIDGANLETNTKEDREIVIGPIFLKPHM